MPEIHARAAIVSIGDELSLGQKLDSNSQWIADRLVATGIVPVEHVTVPDDLERHTAALRRLAEDVDVIVSTGGLGPTADDLTRQALAGAMEDSLVEDPIALAEVEGWFGSRGRLMPAINRVQALRPTRGKTLPNLHGTAPGVYGQIRAATRAHVCDVLCLPGPPKEMMPMFESQVLPRLRPSASRTVRTRVLHCIGIGESELATMLGPLMDRVRNPLIGTTASGGVISVRIRYEGPLPPAEAEAEVAKDERAVREKAGVHIFGAEDQTLGQTLVDALRTRKRSLAVVESCTGGLLAGAMTEIAGCSAVFVQGWVTYSNLAKHREVGVPLQMLNINEKGEPVDAPDGPGAVSGEVAVAMARGGLERSGADYCLSITGIAGPGGGSTEKPVGTVHIGLASRVGEEIHAASRKFKMSGDREAIRSWSVRAAMAVLWLELSGHPEIRLLRQVQG